MDLFISDEKELIVGDNDYAYNITDEKIEEIVDNYKNNPIIAAHIDNERSRTEIEKNKQLAMKYKTEMQKLGKLIDDSDIDDEFKIYFKMKARNKFDKDLLKFDQMHDSDVVKGIKIDKNIKTLISLLWRLGINTCFSCEHAFKKNHMWITFSDIQNYRKFEHYVFKMGHEECDERLKTSFAKHWKLSPKLNLDATDFLTGMWLIFPKSDYDALCKILTKVCIYFESMVADMDIYRY